MRVAFRPVLTSLPAAALLAGLLACATPAAAQPGGTSPAEMRGGATGAGASLPPWAVLTLKLVSTTHVRPTTGVVLSADGLVLVPAEFAEGEEELVVLDGGTDIVRHGRPGRVVRVFENASLAVLQVPGLARRPPVLAAAPPPDQATLGLLAFPPAEAIAEGEPPLRAETRYLAPPPTSARRPEIAEDAALPNLTGPLVDACGHLVAYQRAFEVPALEPSAGARVQWLDDLTEMATGLGLALERADCDITPEPDTAETPPAQVGAETREPEPPPQAEQETPPAPEPEPEPEELGEDAATDEAPAQEESPEEPEVATPESPLAGEERPAGADEAGGPAEPSATERAERSLVARALSLTLLLAVAALAAWWFARRRVGAGIPTAPEPATRPLAPAAGALVVEGALGDGTPVHATAPLHDGAVDAVLGRGDVEIPLATDRVSREHARLRGRVGALTVTDLGSRNGTRVNGVPCLPGEAFYLDETAELSLGDVRLRCRVVPPEGEAP